MISFFRNLATRRSTFISDIDPLPVSSAVSGATTLTYTSAVAEKSAVIKATTGAFFGIEGYTTETAFIHVFDSATVPGLGATPIHRKSILINTDFSIQPPLGVNFDNGISFAVSSTLDTLTISVNDSVSVTAYFITTS